MDTFEDYLKKHIDNGINEFKIKVDRRGEVMMRVSAEGYLTDDGYYIVDNNRLVPVK